jgi:hypothetical protein
MAAVQAERRVALMRAEAAEEERFARRRAYMRAAAEAAEREAKRRAYTPAEAEAAAWLAYGRAWVEAELAEADPAELILIGAVFALGTALVLACFLVPGISLWYQARCCETAAVCFLVVGKFVWRHPVVRFPAMRRWYGRGNQKPSTETCAGYAAIARDLRSKVA